MKKHARWMMEHGYDCDALTGFTHKTHSNTVAMSVMYCQYVTLMIGVNLLQSDLFSFVFLTSEPTLQVYLQTALSFEHITLIQVEHN